GPERITTRPPGYLLEVSDEEIDVARFEALIAGGRNGGDPRERSARLGDALSLWRGGAPGGPRRAPVPGGGDGAVGGVGGGRGRSVAITSWWRRSSRWWQSRCSASACGVS